VAKDTVVETGVKDGADPAGATKRGAGVSSLGAAGVTTVGASDSSKGLGSSFSFANFSSRSLISRAAANLEAELRRSLTLLSSSSSSSGWDRFKLLRALSLSLELRESWLFPLLGCVENPILFFGVPVIPLDLKLGEETAGS